MSVDAQELVSPERNSVSVSLRSGDLSAEFRGTPDEVNRSISLFLAKELPAYGLAKKLWLKYSNAELIDSFSEFVKLTSEGPVVITGDKKLSDRQLVAVRLVAQQIAFDAGAAESNLLSLSQLQESISLNPKTISSRLSELSKLGNVIKETQNGASGFRITTLGINSIIEDLKKKDRKVSKSS
jgi:predicted transcriptional regulator